METAPAPRAGCPVQLTTFIGREREIAAVDDLLQSTRLVTLTGVGGAGKTRLAAEVAARVTPRFEASAWVDLASLSDPALRSEEHTSELQSQSNLVCRLLLEKKKQRSAM